MAIHTYGLNAVGREERVDFEWSQRDSLARLMAALDRSDVGCPAHVRLRKHPLRQLLGLEGPSLREQALPGGDG
jgi:hypothetical protein